MSALPTLPGLAADSPLRQPLPELVAAIGARRARAAGYAQACLARMREAEPAIHAFKGVDEARVLAQAQAVDDAVAAGATPGPLAGIPFGVKDIIDAAGWVTGMGSPIHDHSEPAQDATLVARLRAAGGYVFAKTVTTEFAFMHPRETRNPWNPAHTPGGSSSGSAAAVAAGCVPAALCTQTNGSVIRPAAFCGIVGYKPSFGAFSAQGVLSYAPTLDQPGCYARSVAGVARIASALAEPGLSIPALPPAMARLRLVALRTPVWPLASAAMQAEFARVSARLAQAGAQVDTRELPDEFDSALDVHRSIMGYEAVRYFTPVQAAHRPLLSAWLNQYLDQAAAISEHAYRDALAARETLRASFSGFLAEHDAAITPPTTGEAPIGIETSGDPSFCTIWTLLGTPALTVPSGLGPSGLPLGLQVVGSECDDQRVLGAAYWCEQVLSFGHAPGARPR
jgi:Asp-tRNA(Asn)/Glu-tRNA(Gln) amidotransferase A subunit family amidase